MKKNCLLFLFFLGTFLPAINAQNPSFHPQELIVQLKPGPAVSITEGSTDTGLPVIGRLNKELGVVEVRQLARSRPRLARRDRPDTERLLLLRFAEDIDVERAAQLYLSTGQVEFAEPNFIGYGGGEKGLAPNDPLYSRQWYLRNDGSFDAESVAGADISMEAAWEFTQGNSEVIVAILDSGARLGHPEFSGRLWENTAEVPGNGMDDDLNGYIDDALAWDFANGDNNPTDDHGHGTNVSGILAATGNNGIGYAGMDWNCQVMICKVLDEENNGFYSWWTEAIYYAVDHGASVINMSIGGESFSSAMRQAVDYAHANDVVVVASMMNTNSSTPFYPAAYDNTIAVGATGADDQRVVPFFWDSATGSNYGAHIDLVAPGSFIYGLDEASDSNYNTFWGGTSQAAPLVSGLAALMKGLAPALDVESLRSILRNTADDQVGAPTEDTPGWDIYYGAGRLNAFRALEGLVNMVSVKSRQAPWSTISLYPNPVSSGAAATLDVRVEQPQEAWLSIRDSLGKPVYVVRIRLEPHTRATLPAELPPGVYWVELRGQDGGAESRKLIVPGH